MVLFYRKNSKKNFCGMSSVSGMRPTKSLSVRKLPFPLTNGGMIKNRLDAPNRVGVKAIFSSPGCWDATPTAATLSAGTPFPKLAIARRNRLAACPRPQLPTPMTPHVERMFQYRGNV